MATPLLRPLGFGEILDGAFALYRRLFLDLFLTALIPFGPFLLLGAIVSLTALGLGGEEATILGGLLTFGALLYTGVAGALIWTALTHQFSAALLGERLGWRQGLRAGWRDLFRVMVSGFLFALANFLAFGVGFAVYMVIVVAAVFGAQAIGVPALGLVLAPLALLGFAPGAFVFISLALFLPAQLNERVFATAALTRSWQLMSGARLKGLALWAIGWLIVLVPTLVVMAILGSIFGFGALFGLEGSESAILYSQLLQQLAQPLVGALTTPFTVALLVLLYFDRRVRMEGLDLELMEAELEEGTEPWEEETP